MRTSDFFNVLELNFFKILFSEGWKSMISNSAFTMVLIFHNMSFIRMIQCD